MCKANESQKLNAIPVIGLSNAVIYVSSRAIDLNSSNNGIKAHQRCHISPDKRAKILSKWQCIHLNEEIFRLPRNFKVEVFHRFVSKLSFLLEQLGVTYHVGHFLCDRLMTAVHIPMVQVPFRAFMP